jgi:hypothetical protein
MPARRRVAVSAARGFSATICERAAAALAAACCRRRSRACAFPRALALALAFARTARWCAARRAWAREAAARFDEVVARDPPVGRGVERGCWVVIWPLELVDCC